MKNCVKVYYLLFICLITNTQAAEKKLIAAHFEFRNARVSHMARNIKKFEKLPFDGIIISDLKSLQLKFPMNATRKWTKKEFADTIKDLKIIASGKLKHNFLLTFPTPRKRIAFCNDKLWERAAHNFGIMAHVARQGECVGLVFDVEDYSGSHQFSYRPEDAPTYEEAAKLARRRGQQFMTAIAKEFPAVKIMGYHLLCAISREVVTQDVKKGAKATGELYQHFVNGMYDKLPPQAKIIEGNEIGYYAQANRPDFSLMALDSVRRDMKYIYPENRYKFKTQGEFAFGLYIDGYARENGSFYKEKLDGTKLKRFRADLAEAMRLTDEYVWLYGEWTADTRKNSYAWLNNWDAKAFKTIFRAKTKKVTTYADAYPGILEAIELAKNPEKVGLEIFAEGKNKLKNLVPNPDCSPDVKPVGLIAPPWLVEGGYLKGPAIVPGWYFWPHWDAKDENRYLDKTSGLSDKFSLFGKNLKRAAFVTDVKIKPGSFYVVEARMQGTGNAFIRVRWRSKVKHIEKYKNYGRDYIAQNISTKDVIFFFNDSKDENEWRLARGVVRAPEQDDAEIMTLFCYMLQGKDSGKYNRFDKIGIYEIQPLTAQNTN
jgi:hypothetical protein